MEYDYIKSTLVQDREQAGKLLAEKLKQYSGKNAVVVGASRGGACVASAIAEELDLPLVAIPCYQIKHPAISNRFIGCVSVDDQHLNEDVYDIPQDYIYHQMILLRNAICGELKFYYGDGKPEILHYKTVILVDEVLQTPGSMLPVLRSVKKEEPLKIVVAVPVVNPEAARVINEDVDDMVFLHMRRIQGEEYYDDFHKVDKEEVMHLLQKAKKRRQQV